MGSVERRARFVMAGLLTSVLWIVVAATFATLTSFYPGTGVARGNSAEKSTVVDVRECERLGPLSTYGYGYWYECRISVTVAGRRTVDGTVGRSIVRPSDIGKKVELREVCSGSGGSDCRYGRPTNRLWTFLVLALGVVNRGVSIAFLALILYYLLNAVLGRRRYLSVVGKMRSRSRRKKMEPVDRWFDERERRRGQ
ncbi:DUF6346 domain-containing protein [Micromonospora sp. NPDC004704]